MNILFISDLDLTSSFGYKSKEYGLKYNLKFEYNKNTSLNTGFSYKFRGLFAQKILMLFLIT